MNAQQKSQRRWYKDSLKTNDHDNNQDIDDNDVDVRDEYRLDHQNPLNAPSRRQPSSQDNENYFEESDIFVSLKREKRSHRKRDKHRKHTKPKKNRKHRKTHSSCKKHGKHRSGCKISHRPHHHHHQHQHQHQHQHHHENRGDQGIDNNRNGNGCDKGRNRDRPSPRQPGSGGCNPTFNDDDDSSDRNDVNVFET